MVKNQKPALGDCETQEKLKPVSFTDKKIHDFSRTFQDHHEKVFRTFRSPQMFKYKEKTAFTYNIQSAFHCTKFSMKQNVDVSC